MIDAYLTDTVTRIRAGAPGAWNEPSAPTESTIAALVQWKRSRVLNQEGVEVIASGHVLAASEFLLSDRLRIDGREYGIIACAPEKSFHDSHYKAWVA